MVFEEGVMELLHCWQDAKLGKKAEKYLDDIVVEQKRGKSIMMVGLMSCIWNLRYLQH